MVVFAAVSVVGFSRLVARCVPFCCKRRRLRLMLGILRGNNLAASLSVHKDFCELESSVDEEFVEEYLVERDSVEALSLTKVSGTGSVVMSRHVLEPCAIRAGVDVGTSCVPPSCCVFTVINFQSFLAARLPRVDFGVAAVALFGASVCVIFVSSCQDACVLDLHFYK